MQAVYDIIYDGSAVASGISEEQFLDLMRDYAESYYETGYPDLTKLSHTAYLKEEYDTRKNTTKD